jgi:signal peptidase
VAIYVTLREILRYQILNKCDGSKTATILTIVLFIVLDITNNLFFYTFDSKYNIFIFLALYLMPALGNNLLATYLNRKTGFRPVIFYMLVMELYTYILPIFPNPNKYIASIINFCVPMVLLYRQYTFFLKENDEDVPRQYNKKSIPWLIISLIITIFLVYFSSGYFRYHAIAVASGSMHPVIEKGDVVIVERVDDDFGRVQVGDVIAFNYNGTIVVHRVINIIQDRSEYFFYTKGDANEGNDNFVVEMDMLKGIVKYRIPFIGYPTVWLNRL